MTTIMRHQAFRPVALMLSVLLIAAVPAQASNIRFADVMQAVVNKQNSGQNVELSLRTASQSGRTFGSTSTSSSRGATSRDSSSPNTTPSAPRTGTATSIIPSGVPAQESSSVRVETIELGDINGTICDCGEIFIPGRGFPKWPLLALGGVPLFFIPGSNPPSPFFPQPPVDNPIPEPTTLLLFGSGLLALGAGVRRRRARVNHPGHASGEKEV